MFLDPTILAIDSNQTAMPSANIKHGLHPLVSNLLLRYLSFTERTVRSRYTTSCTFKVSEMCIGWLLPEHHSHLHPVNGCAMFSCLVTWHHLCVLVCTILNVRANIYTAKFLKFPLEIRKAPLEGWPLRRGIGRGNSLYSARPWFARAGLSKMAFLLRISFLFHGMRIGLRAGIMSPTDLFCENLTTEKQKDWNWQEHTSHLQARPHKTCITDIRKKPLEQFF